jgi:dihydrofolate reductase
MMHVSLLAAVTKDGFIARSETDKSFDWTSAEDKAFYIQTIKAADVIIMGLKTFNTFTRYPKGKTYVIITRHPQNFVNPKPTVITAIPTNSSPGEILSDLDKKGFKTVVIAGGRTVYTLFLEANLVDTVYLTVETDIEFNDGIPLFTKPINLPPPSKTALLSPTTILNQYQLK